MLSAPLLVLFGSVSSTPAAWKRTACMDKLHDGVTTIQTGGKYCCSAQGDATPVPGAHYRFAGSSFVLDPKPGDGCSPQSCYATRLICDDKIVEHIPASGKSCGNRGSQNLQTGTSDVFECSESFSVCIHSHDPSPWPAEYCLVMDNLTLSFESMGARGPESFLDRYKIALILLAVCTGVLWFMWLLLSKLSPRVANQWKVPFFVIGSICCLVVVAFPRLVVEEWRPAMELMSEGLVLLFVVLMVQMALTGREEDTTGEEEALRAQPGHYYDPRIRPSAPPLEER